MLPGFVTLLLVRIGLGERLEKAKSEDYRAVFGFLFLLPCWLGLSAYLGHSFFDHASGLAIWAAVVASGLLFLVAQAVWVLFIPASVSLWLLAPLHGLPFCGWRGRARYGFSRDGIYQALKPTLPGAIPSFLMTINTLPPGCARSPQRLSFVSLDEKAKLYSAFAV